MVDDLNTYPVLKAVIGADHALQQEIWLRKISLAVDDHAYALVDEKGVPRPANVEFREGDKAEILWFDAVWTEGSEVWTLNVVTKVKRFRIGKLVSLY